jgi:hypothetical protein
LALPADSTDVIAALRLGWFVAEVRGRNRIDAPVPEVGVLPQRLDHFLPLRGERKSEELRIEAQAVMSALALRLNVAKDVRVANYAEEIEDLAKQLDAVRGKPAADAIWKRLANQLYYFDAHIQDALSSSSETQATAYLLGRGLSEAYWALDLGAEVSSATSWAFLLGTERCGELSRGVGRLSAYFNVYTAPAIAGSLVAWGKVATTSDWRSLPSARQQLYLQIRRWYEMLVLGQDPSTLIKPYTILKSWRAAAQTVSTFAWQLGTLVASLGLVVGLAALTASGKSNAGLNTLLGVVSAAGITTAAVQTNLKNSAQNALTRLRQDVYTDLVAGEITDLPNLPGKSEKEMHKITIDACQKRTMTTVASA